MATTQEKSEVVTREHVKSEPVQQDLPNEQMVSSELDQPRPLSPEEQVDTEQMSAEHVNHDHINQQPDHSELMHSQPVGSEHAHSELVHPQPVDPEHAHSELVHSQRVGPEHAHSEPASSEYVHSEPVNAEFTQSEPINAEFAHSQPLNSEIVHSEPVHSELVHSHPVNSELVHSQPINSELVHSEPANPGQQLDHHEMSNSQPIETEMRMEMEPHHQNNQLVPVPQEHIHTDPMNTEPVGSEFDNQHPISSEMIDSQMITSEMYHTQMVDSEMVHSHPMCTELVASHSMGSQFGGSQLGGSEIANYEMVPAEAANPETQPNKRRKKKSVVWEHFTIENVGAGCRRACCKVCKQSFAYSTGNKVAGTSHLKRHIAKGTCPVMLRQHERNQLTPYMPKPNGAETATEPPKRRYRSSSSPYLIFDQDRCRHEIAKMIIMHDYPLHMVEHPGFIAFVQNLQPRFDMVNYDTVRGDCVATYINEMQKLQRFMGGMPGRISLSVDMWTSPQTTGYVFLTGQFIDNEWKLHRRLLNVVQEPFPESDTALSHAVNSCLKYWTVDNKLASITFNQSPSDTGLEHLRALLAVKNPLILNGQLLIKNCLARTLSTLAQDVLAAGQETVKKIRSSVKYVKASDNHEEKFLELKQQLQVPSEKNLCLDNLTKWNTTYEMLLAASELKEVFSCLDTSDPDYRETPSVADWKQVEDICTYLKLLYETASLLTSKTCPPSNVFFHEIWKIQLELGRASSSEDPFVSGLAKSLQERFHKYWQNSCLILAVAVAMDPRFKMKLVEFSFTKLFGEDAPGYIRVVDAGIHELFDEYGTVYAEDGSSATAKTNVQQGGANGLTDFDVYIMETTNQQNKSELDLYLEESLLPRIPDFDVLGWWKLNMVKYPTLYNMARDILSIPLCTVGPDLVFDTVTREMDQYRCSLRAETVEALICAKDWLQHESTEAPVAPLKIEL